MVTPKTLRRLAKAEGFKPATIFRMKPEELIELVKEKIADVDSWDDAKAEEHIKSLVSKTPDSATPPTEVKASEPAKKEKTKRTRRTKAQMEEARRLEAAKREEAVLDVKKTLDELEKEGLVATVDIGLTKGKDRDKPSRRRKKKNPVPITSTTGQLGDLEELKERIINLEEANKSLAATLRDISLFFTWFHNAKIDPTEPISTLHEIDWKGCIDDQLG